VKKSTANTISGIIWFVVALFAVVGAAALVAVPHLWRWVASLWGTPSAEWKRRREILVVGAVDPILDPAKKEPKAVTLAF